MAAKRGDRVAPPGKPSGWEARFATSEAAKGWESLCHTARSNTWEAWIVLTERPATPVNRRIVWVVAAAPSHPKATD